MENSQNKYQLLLLTTFIISGCSMIYELIISALSSYLLGNSVLQYSITIGLYMFSLGIGSYLSRYIKRDLFQTLVSIEILIGILGGLSSLILFYAYIYIINFPVVLYGLIILIGILAGAEIPILTRIVEDNEHDLKKTLSSILSFDYIGGLVGALLFPLLLLPQLGFIATSFLTGFLNVVSALLILWRYHAEIHHAWIFRLFALFLALTMLLGMIFSKNLSNEIEGGIYRDQVIYREQSQYQHIVITKHKDDTRLFLDGNIQFAEMDEYRYHEALVHIPMSQVENPKEILVLGGGDGLAVRELLKYDSIEHIDLVDLDPTMTDLAKENPHIVEINGGSLHSDKVSIYNQDAFEFLEDTEKLYDLIIIDLPDPNSESLNKLYSNLFYRLLGQRLNSEGVFVTQSTSPFYASKAFWCINKTIASEGFNVVPYHLEVPSFGDWGFNMASKSELTKNIEIGVETEFLNRDILPALFSFSEDELAQDVEINQFSKPILMIYYNEASRNWE